MALFYSCGGVIGGIEKYDFNLTKVELESAINSMIKDDSTSTKNLNDTLYNLKGTGYENIMIPVYVTEGGTKYVLTFSYLGDSTQWASSKSTTINLISGAKYGDVIKLSSKLSNTEKSRYKSLFELYIVNKINRAVR